MSIQPFGNNFTVAALGDPALLGTCDSLSQGLTTRHHAVSQVHVLLWPPFHSSTPQAQTNTVEHLL